MNTRAGSGTRLDQPDRVVTSRAGRQRQVNDIVTSPRTRPTTSGRGVQFFVDGVAEGAEDTAAPYG